MFHGKPLNHEAAFPKDHDDVPMLGIDRSINDQCVSLVDPKPRHAVPLGRGKEGCWRVADAVLIEAERVLCGEEVLSRAWEATADAHPHQGQSMGRCSDAESA